MRCGAVRCGAVRSGAQSENCGLQSASDGGSGSDGADESDESEDESESEVPHRAVHPQSCGVRRNAPTRGGMTRKVSYAPAAKTCRASLKQNVTC